MITHRHRTGAEHFRCEKELKKKYDEFWLTRWVGTPLQDVKNTGSLCILAGTCRNGETELLGWVSTTAISITGNNRLCHINVAAAHFSSAMEFVATAPLKHKRRPGSLPTASQGTSFHAEIDFLFFFTSLVRNQRMSYFRYPHFGQTPSTREIPHSGQRSMVPEGVYSWEAALTPLVKVILAMFSLSFSNS